MLIILKKWGVIMKKFIRILFIIAIVLVGMQGEPMPAMNGDFDGNGKIGLEDSIGILQVVAGIRQDDIVDYESKLSEFYGDYDVVFEGRTGGPYEPTGSMFTGTTTGIKSFTLSGTITVEPSELGVLTVPQGEVIPGVEPEDIIFGMAVMQNPIHVFLGTTKVTRTGDFNLHSMLEFGVPSGYADLSYTGCSGGGVFGCVPVFFQSTGSTGSTVNLIYCVIRASNDGSTLTINGKLVDKHAAEAVVSNFFSVPIESPLLGNMIDSFYFENGLLYEIVITGNNVSGWIEGEGRSAAGLAAQTAIFEATFEGNKSK